MRVPIPRMCPNSLDSEDVSFGPMAAGALTTEELARLLKEAAEAHHDYEQQLGEPDENWPTWYAEFILDQLRRS